MRVRSGAFPILFQYLVSRIPGVDFVQTRLELTWAACSHFFLSTTDLQDYELVHWGSVRGRRVNYVLHPGLGLGIHHQQVMVVAGLQRSVYVSMDSSKFTSHHPSNSNSSLNSPPTFNTYCIKIFCTVSHQHNTMASQELQEPQQHPQSVLDIITPQFPH